MDEVRFASNWITANVGLLEELRERSPGLNRLTRRPSLREISVDHVWIEARLNDEWIAAFRLHLQQGQPVISEMRIFPFEDFEHRPHGEWSASQLGKDAAPPHGGLTMPVIRAVRLNDVRSKIASTLELWRSKAPYVLDSMQFNPKVPDVQRRKTNDGQGRPRLADVELARLARVYADLCKKGSLTPIKDTAAFLEEEEGTVRNRVREARLRKLLTPGFNGRPGGQLTEAGKAILKGEKKRGKKV